MSELSYATREVEKYGLSSCNFMPNQKLWGFLRCFVLLDFFFFLRDRASLSPRLDLSAAAQS